MKVGKHIVKPETKFIGAGRVPTIKSMFSDENFPDSSKKMKALVNRRA